MAKESWESWPTHPGEVKQPHDAQPAEAAQHPDAQIINALGGPSVLAQTLGYDKSAGGAQRVQNWLTRGIPSAVKADHPHLFLPSRIGGVSISLQLGQHVRHRDFKGKRVTGVVQSLSIEPERGLMVDIILDEAIVIEVEGERPINIYRQHVPAHEVQPFDERDELIAELAGLLKDGRDDLAIAASSWNQNDDRQVADFHRKRVLSLLERVDEALTKVKGGDA